MSKTKTKKETSKQSDIELSLIEHNNRIEDNAVDIKELHDKTDKLLSEMSILRDITNKVRGRLGI